MPDAKPPARTTRRTVLRLGVLLGLLVLSAVVLLTRPWVLMRVILPNAARNIGGEVTASVIRMGAPDEIVIEDLRVRAPQGAGEAYELARADRIRVRFELLPLLWGDLRVTRVSVGRLSLRMAEFADRPGEFTALLLKPAPSDAPAQRPATISIDDLVLESGIVSGERYERLGDLRFRGALTPVLGDAYSFAVKLQGLPDSKGTLAVGEIEGSFDGGTRAFDVSVSDVVVRDGSISVAPLRVRAWARELGLEGRIRSARMSSSEAEGTTAEIDVDGLAMDLPIEQLGDESLDAAWKGFEDGRMVDLEAKPRMTLREGVLRLSDDRITLEKLEGALGAREKDSQVLPVPFECSFALDLPNPEGGVRDWGKADSWLRESLAAAPFRLDLGIRRFSSPEGDDAARTLQLPRAAAKILSDFDITRWTINVDTRIERGVAARAGQPAPIRSSGTLRLERGSGAYREFPYRLDDVSAVISFENDNLTIERLTGRGAEGAMVAIDGRLTDIKEGAEIEVNITCADAPIDRRLFDAFEEGPRAGIEILFDGRAAGTLAAAGLLPDKESLDRQRAELTALGDGERARDDRARLQRSVDAGPFALGGRCGFNIRVYSPKGFDQPVIVTGDVRVRDAGLVFERFPYPLRIRSGSFTVLDEAVVIGGDGLRAITPAGGMFTVKGSVNMPRDGKGGRDIRPLIEIADSDDAVNPALLASIPHDDDGRERPQGWPGADLAPAGRLLEALGLSGRIELDGLVSTKADGSEDFRVRLAFSQGRAEPDADGRAYLATQGLEWPKEFALDECSTRLDIVPERVTFEQCAGNYGTGSVVARGFASLDGPDRLVEIELRNLPIGRAFEPYLAADPAVAAERFRDFAPSGSLDGMIRREVGASGSRTSGSLMPRTVEVTLDGSRVRAERSQGRIAIDDRGVTAEALQFRLWTGDRDDGELRLSGSLDVDEPEGTADALEATIRGGRVESPATQAVLARRAPAVQEALRALDATGVFDARYVRTADERVTVTPKVIELGRSGERVELDFAERDRVTVDETGVRFDADATMRGAAEGRYTVSGTVSVPQGQQLLAASVRIDAAALTPALRALLPAPLASSAETIDLTSAGAFTLALPAIEGRWRPGADLESPDTFTMRGETAFKGASFDCGARIDGVDGTLPFELAYEPRSAAPVRFTATLSAERARVFDRELGAGTTRIATARGGEVLEIAGAGDFYSGRYDLDARVDFERKEYSMRARVADASFARVRDPKAATLPASQGRLAGTLTLRGPLGGTPEALAARTGEGRVGVRDATMASEPIAMRVLQLSQLMLPVSGVISACDVDFTVRGAKAQLDRVLLESGTLRLDGTGTVDIPTFAIGLRLFPRGTVPLLSDVVGGVTNQLFAIDVTGTVGEPQVAVAPLPQVVKPPEAAPRQDATPDATTTTPAGPAQEPAPQRGRR
ncbi:MAG: hypothetical protein ACKOYN_13180 [Planctomycetota bacterium]